MEKQLISAFIISLLHGFIPGHWLPFLGLANKMGWSKATTMRYTSMAAFAHALGTILIGLTIALLTRFSVDSSESIKLIAGFHFNKVGASILIVLGFWFLYRHHRHHHFHFPETEDKSQSKWVFWSIFLALFLSPCMEIEAYFLTLAPMGWPIIALLIVMYFTTTWLSMMGGIWIGYSGIKKWNSHKLEHNAGLITGFVMVLSGLLLFFS